MRSALSSSEEIPLKPRRGRHGRPKGARRLSDGRHGLSATGREKTRARKPVPSCRSCFHTSIRTTTPDAALFSVFPLTNDCRNLRRMPVHGISWISMGYHGTGCAVNAKLFGLKDLLTLETPSGRRRPIPFNFLIFYMNSCFLTAGLGYYALVWPVYVLFYAQNYLQKI